MLPECNAGIIMKILYMVEWLNFAFFYFIKMALQVHFFVRWKHYVNHNMRFFIIVQFLQKIEYQWDRVYFGWSNDFDILYFIWCVSRHRLFLFSIIFISFILSILPVVRRQLHSKQSSLCQSHNILGWMTQGFNNVITRQSRIPCTISCPEDIISICTDFLSWSLKWLW